jgi:hypothetical protein
MNTAATATSPTQTPKARATLTGSSAMKPLPASSAAVIGFQSAAY